MLPKLQLGASLTTAKSKAARQGGRELCSRCCWQQGSPTGSAPICGMLCPLGLCLALGGASMHTSLCMCPYLYPSRAVPHLQAAMLQQTSSQFLLHSPCITRTKTGTAFTSPDCFWMEMINAFGPWYVVLVQLSLLSQRQQMCMAALCWDTYHQPPACCAITALSGCPLIAQAQHLPGCSLLFAPSLLPHSPHPC